MKNKIIKNFIKTILKFKHHHSRPANKGISLIELLLVITILTILGVMSYTNYLGYKKNTEIDLSAIQITQTLRKAQSYSMSGEDLYPWGVCFNPISNNYTLFECSAATCNPTERCSNGIKKNITYLSSPVIFNNFTINGLPADNVIFFNRATGKTNYYGTEINDRAFCLTTTDDPAGCVIKILVNANGKIETAK